jgi:hypothetical protein
MGKDQKAETQGGDLSSRATVLKRICAVLDAAKDKIKVEVSSTELKMALKFYVDGIQGHETLVGLLEKELLETAETETVEHAELEPLHEYFHLAEIAYEEDTEVLRSQVKEHGYELQTHFKNKNVGEVGYYTALDHNNQTLLIGVKGTSSFADAMTDAVAVTMPHVCSPTCPFTGSDDPREILCHEGILAAALNMYEQIYETIKEVALKSGYKIRICGHSLGAGTASLLGVLLRTRANEKLRDPDYLRVYAIACPPVLDFQSSHQAKSFITSVVNKSDVVPRLSIANLEVLTKMLNGIALAIKTDYNKGNDYNSPAAAIRRANKLIEKAKEEGFDPEEINKIKGMMTKDFAAVDVESRENLFVPGRVIVFYEKPIDPSASASAFDSEDCCTEQHVGTGAVVVGGSHWVRVLKTRKTLTVACCRLSTFYSPLIIVSPPS